MQDKVTCLEFCENCETLRKNKGDAISEGSCAKFVCVTK